MAHECPTCGAVCYCNGDIDDIILNDSVTESNCKHWQKCEEELMESEHDPWLEDEQHA